MPIIAVGIAVAADVGAATAVIGTVGGIAAISTVTALEVVAAVGATVSAIGAVTGNKTLQTVGMVVGAVGGIGALAAGAGLLGSDAASSAPLFGAAPTASTADAASAGTIDFVGGTDSSGLPSDLSGVDASGLPPGVGDASEASVTANAADPAASIPGAVPAGTDMSAQDAAALQTSTSDAAASGTSTADTAIGETPIVPPSGATASANPIPSLPPGALGTGGAAAPGVGGDGIVPTDAPVPDMTGLPDGANIAPVPAAMAPDASGLPATAAASTSGSSGGIFSSILGFTKSNPLLSYGLLQAGGSLLSGLTSTLTPAQVSALNAQASANNAAAALTAQQTANLAMPKSVASSAPVTGTPQTLVPGAAPAAPTTGQGLINQAPAQAPVPSQVTGAPA
jgi:hypothetical protein